MCKKKYETGKWAKKNEKPGAMKLSQIHRRIKLYMREIILCDEFIRFTFFMTAQFILVF
jgi:hypothetical protein